jgi:hypothetical protein
MKHFVILFDRTKMSITEKREFTRGADAHAFFAKIERAHLRNEDVEVALLSGTSEESLRVSHPQYFDGFRQGSALFRRLNRRDSLVPAE